MLDELNLLFLFLENGYGSVFLEFRHYFNRVIFVLLGKYRRQSFKLGL